MGASVGVVGPRLEANHAGFVSEGPRLDQDVMVILAALPRHVTGKANIKLATFAYVAVWPFTASAPRLQ